MRADHVRAGRVGAAAGLEWRVGLPNLDVRDPERAQELYRPRGIVLRAQVDDVRVGAALRLLAPDDLARAHPPDVVEEVVFQSRRQVERRTRGRDHVFDGLAQRPASAQPRVGVVDARDLRRQVLVPLAEGLGHLLRRVTVRCRVAVEGGLGEEAGHVVKIGPAPHAAVPPDVVQHVTAVAGLFLLVEALPHRLPDLVDRAHDQRVEIGVHGVLHGRAPDAARKRARLVVVVDHLRVPHLVELSGHRLRLDLREHRPVAVVVVADVVVIQLRRRRRLEGRAEVLRVPRPDDVEPVGIHRWHEEQDRVLAHPACFLVFRGDQPPAELRRVLRPRHFGRVEAAVDPHDGLALFRQGACPRLVHPARDGELPRDLLEPGPVPDVGLARDGGEDHRPALAALADLLDDDAVRGGIELVEVLDDLLVAGELVVVAGREPEDVLRLRHSRDGWRLWRGGAALRDECGRRQRKRRREGERNERAARQQRHGVLEGHCYISSGVCRRNAE